MENMSKNAKIIGIGNEGINNLESIYNVVKENVDTEKISINQDVDKDYVRALLDGVDILLLTYSTEDKRAVDIVKAISFMAGERRVLSVGINSSQKEHKEELGLNIEFIINEENTNDIMSLINLMIEAVSDDCSISVDLTDLKELFSGDGGVKYSYKVFNENDDAKEVAKKLIENTKEAGSDFLEKKCILFTEMKNSDSILLFLNNVLTSIEEEIASTYEIIFSLYIKEDLNDEFKLGIIYN